jgi:hypothetical protein
MAIQYNGTTIGTLTLCQAKRVKNDNGKYVELKDEKGHTVYNEFPIQIRDGNCLAIFLHIWKDPEPEDPERPWHHDLQMFFVDEAHLKRCLKGYRQGEAFEKIIFGKLKNIRLNIYYKNMLTLARYMTRDGLEVKCYYKEPKKK